MSDKEALRRLVELQEEMVRLTEERIKQLEREQAVLADLRRSLAELGQQAPADD